jgi:hypothetical protein
MSLRDLALQCEYRSDQTNTISDFYVPCFKESTAYWQAVGYFTSQGLLLAAKGLAEFLKHGGRMRLVASPWLDEEDVEALIKGYEAREEIVQRAILRPFNELAAVDISGLLRHRLECLAWLVAEERLEIKLALPLTKLLAGERGIYHEKVGLFFDQQGNTVAFTGSPNETIGGLVSNFESIHHEGLLKSLPNLQVQVFLLATDRDLPADERDKIAGRIASAFEIHRDQRQARSFIKEA